MEFSPLSSTPPENPLNEYQSPVLGITVPARAVYLYVPPLSYRAMVVPAGTNPAFHVPFSVMVFAPMLTFPSS